MAVCPWVVNTDLVQSALGTMTQQERDRKQSSWVHKMMSPADVAVAVEQMLLTGKPGDVVSVGPGQ